jgi:hypothetical protein
MSSPSLSHRPRGPRRLVLAEITPRHHLQSQTSVEYRILKRHWITSLKLVEHGENLRWFARAVQSQKLRHSRVPPNLSPPPPSGSTLFLKERSPSMSDFTRKSAIPSHQVSEHERLSELLEELRFELSLRRQNSPVAGLMAVTVRRFMADIFSPDLARAGQQGIAASARRGRDRSATPAPGAP